MSVSASASAAAAFLSQSAHPVPLPSPQVQSFAIPFAKYHSATRFSSRFFGSILSPFLRGEWSFTKTIFITQKIMVL
jgi:hypothetical protein